MGDGCRGAAQGGLLQAVCLSIYEGGCHLTVGVQVRMSDNDDISSCTILLGLGEDGKGLVVWEYRDHLSAII